VDNTGKSWLTGCGCGCLNAVGFTVLTYGLCIGGAWALWEVFDVRERFLRGESVLLWGAFVAVAVAFVVGLITVFVGQRVSFKRFERSGSGGGKPTDAGMDPVRAAWSGAPPDISKPGCLMPGIWLGVTALVTLAGLAYFGIAVSGSERAGVEATYIVAGPLGIVWSGCLAAIIVHLAMKKASTGVRAGVPIGCGCLGGVTLFLLILVFFAVIWPEL